MDGVNQYGPATPVVETMLMRANGLVAAEQGALWGAYLLTRGEGPHRLLLMPRDYAWRRLHDGLDAHGLRQEFTLLWKQLITRPEPSRSALDAVCAALLEPFAGAGPFRMCDFDTLMSPWRWALEQCPRSRLALNLMHQHPHEVGPDWWVVVDAVLAPAQW